MNLIKGDKVIVIAGKDKGKTGAIQKVDPKTNRVVVEGVNLRKKHKKPTQANPEGSIVEIYAPIDASNVMLESLLRVALNYKEDKHNGRNKENYR